MGKEEILEETTDHYNPALIDKLFDEMDIANKVPSLKRNPHLSSSKVIRKK